MGRDRPSGEPFICIERRWIRDGFVIGLDAKLNVPLVRFVIIDDDDGGDFSCLNAVSLWTEDVFSIELTYPVLARDWC